MLIGEGGIMKFMYGRYYDLILQSVSIRESKARGTPLLEARWYCLEVNDSIIDVVALGLEMDSIKKKYTFYKVPEKTRIVVEDLQQKLNITINCKVKIENYQGRKFAQLAWNNLYEQSL